MSYSTSPLCHELAVFCDLGTDPPQATRHDHRLTVRMIRDGDPLRLDFLDDGRVTEGPPNGPPSRTHASYRALLASETFGNLRRWADHQKTVLQGALRSDDRIPVEGVLSKKASTFDVTALDDHLLPMDSEDNAVRIMLIDGPAGIGKTKFIESLAASRANDFMTKRRPLVLHVQSRGRVLTFLQDLMAFSLQRLRLSVTFDQLPVLVRHGLVTLAIDGFDELGDPNGYDLAWGQVNDIVDQIRGKGTLVLAGRETFIGRERISKKIKSLKPYDQLDALSLQVPDPDVAKSWLRNKGWSEDDVKSAEGFGLFDQDYALRPFFLVQLADPSVAATIGGSAAGPPLAFLVEMMLNREVNKFGDALDRLLSEEQRRDFLRRLLREIARFMADDQTEAIDEVSIAWLVEFAVPEGLDPGSLGLLKNRAAVVAFIENDDAPGYRRFASSQLLNYFLAELTVDTISKKEIPKFMRRNLLGADFLAAFSDLILDAATERDRVRAFFDFASETARTYLNVDRGARNLGALLLTALPAMDGVRDLRIEGIDMDESLIQTTAPEALIVKTAVNQLDIQGANLEAVTFEDCWIGTLIVDDTTRVPPTCPAPDRIRIQGLGANDDSVLETHEETMTWLGEHGRVQPAAERHATDRRDDADPASNDLRDSRLITLLERACRHRAYWIPRDGDNGDPAAGFVNDPSWGAVLGLLREHELVREEQRAARGNLNWFVHLKRRTDILSLLTRGSTPDPGDPQMHRFYGSLGGTIRGRRT